MLSDFLVPFVTVGIAELGDKTQFAVLSLASKTKKHAQLLAGVMLAFLIADGVAIYLGDFITQLIPLKIIRIIAGLLFILFGILTLRQHEEKGKTTQLRSPFMSGFSLILVSELGDKTQIAAGLLATRYNAWMTFFGVMLALFVISVLAVYASKLLTHWMKPKTLTYVSGGIFLLLGIAQLVMAFS